MNIDIPKITKTIHLQDYAPEFGEAILEVWVNPPRKLLVEVNELSQETFDQEKYKTAVDVLAQIWGCPAEDVTRLIEHSADTDPLLFPWLLTKTFVLIREHRTQLKKN